MLKLALSGVIVLCFFLCSAAAQSKLDKPCPKTPLEAAKQATQDVEKFKKMYNSGTWAGFLHQYKTNYGTCPANIKNVYIDAARQLMNASAPRVNSFQSSPKK